jgi:hypothetical protein
MRRAPILVVIAIVVTAIVTHAAMMLTYSETRITAQGTIKTVGVEAYWDAGCTDEVTEIDWGTLEPGFQTETAFYVKNQGNTPVTLSLGVEAWSPSEAQTYMSLDWDYDGRPVNPDTAIPVRMTLTVSTDITGITAFSFQIVITAQG